MATTTNNGGFAGKVAFVTRPLRASTTECSMSAMPMQPIMPPMH